MRTYDPQVDPDPAQWLAADETERIDSVRAYHRAERIRIPSERAHAAIHTAVENQLAERIPSVVSALDRLRGSGLDRHEALHAIAWVLLQHMSELVSGPPTRRDPNPEYFAALDLLTAESWRASTRDAKE